MPPPSPRLQWLLALLVLSPTGLDGPVGALGWSIRSQVGSARADGMTICQKRIDDCIGPYCIENVKCDHGLCGQSGQCECQPCYSGPSCQRYDDKYGPRFAIPEDTIIITAAHTGVVYKATAEDEDLGLTCPLGPGLNTRCPCAAVSYSLIGDTQGLFNIHGSSGQVSLREGVELRPGRQYRLQIMASNMNATDSTPVRHLTAVQTLTVMVHSDDKLQDLLHQDPDSNIALIDTGYDVPGNSLASLEGEVVVGEEEPQALDRKKRESAGPDGEKGSTKLIFTRMSVPTIPLKPGHSIDYKLEIVLPTLSTAMDLDVEIFVMDPVSGISPFALCDFTVVSIGPLITDSGGTALNLTKIQEDAIKQVNTQFKTFTDRVVINFGDVKNSDASGSTGVYNDSTITITFTATVIKNEQYTNTSVMVTAGAEYDQQQYVTVSTDSIDVNMAPAEVYTIGVTSAGPTTVAEYAGATFILDAYVTVPFDELVFEVASKDQEYDLFSVTNIGIMSVGTKWSCMDANFHEYNYDKSVTGRTNHRGTITMKLLLSHLDYSHLGTSTEVDYRIKFYVSILLYGAKAGDSITVTLGVAVGISLTWTEDKTITVSTGSLTPSGALAAFTGPDALTSTQVGAAGTATWGITAAVTAGGGAQLACTITPGAADSEVCGVVYGILGANIAGLPDLNSVVIYTAGVASFDFFVNSTGQATGDTKYDAVQLEISVTYKSAVGDTTVDCGGTPLTLTSTSGTAGTSDMSGTVESLVTDTTWYAGSQAGLVVTTNFPANGFPYESLEMEGTGDLDLTGWGARLCAARVVSAGRGVPCIAGSMNDINTNIVTQKSKTDSPYLDGYKLTMGSACGTNRLSGGPAYDNQVVIKMFYELPPSQAISAEEFNMTAGIKLGTSLIWTGWSGLNVAISSPAYDSTKAPIVGVIEPDTTVLVPGVPTIIKVVVKFHPGSVHSYTVKASVDATTGISICRLFILEAGPNFPCIDKEPYDKENLPDQVTKITHTDATDYGKEITLDLGILRNLATRSMYSQLIADEDSIVLGVLMKGVETGGTLTIDVVASGTAQTPVTKAFTVSTALPTGTNNLPAVVPVGIDGTLNAFEGIMKLINVPLVVPEDYAKSVKVTISTTAITDITVCYAAVVSAGLNTPCVIPAQLDSVDESVAGSMAKYVVDLKGVCFYKVSANATENEIVVQFGATFLPNSAGSTANIDILVTENDVDQSPVTIALTKDTGTYTPGTINTTLMAVDLIDDAALTAKPGERVWIGIKLTVPRDETIPVEIGVMTPSATNRAMATLHGFRLSNTGTQGQNLGCLLDSVTMYESELTQNASLAKPLAHESQKDTLIVDLKYITNHGKTYVQKAEVPEDDQLFFEADVMIADHPDVTNGGTIEVSFAVKVANTVIFVIKKPITVDKTSQVMDVVTDLKMTDDPAPIFNQGNQIHFTLQVYHTNTSSLEAKNASVRVLMPKYLFFVNDSALGTLDVFTPNMTGYPTFSGYLDFPIEYLLFTDILEANFSLTVDPNEVMPKGLGTVNATTLMRLVCATNLVADLKYCGTTAHVTYLVNGEDCTDPLNVGTMIDCQLAGSSAIDTSSAPGMAKAGSGSGWSPGVRSGSSMKHHFTIDFTARTRVSKLTFEEVTGAFSVKTFKMQSSQNGYIFKDTCTTVIDVPADGIVILPGECRFNARYGRILIASVSDGLGATAVTDTSTKKIGVRFTDWYGCSLDTAGTCSNLLTTPLTNDPTKYRHASYDATNDQVYFCDVNVKRGDGLACFCGSDGATWNAVPSYVGYMVGFDSGSAKMYAKDRKGTAMVSTSDCVNWSIVGDATATAIQTSATAPIPIPGKTQTDLGTVTVGGGWTADFTGLMKSGAYKAKWADCCT